VSATIGGRRRLQVAYTYMPCVFPFIAFASPRFLCYSKRWATKHSSLLVIRFRLGTCERFSDTQFKRSPTGSKSPCICWYESRKLVSRYSTSHNLPLSQCRFSMLVSDVPRWPNWRSDTNFVKFFQRLGQHLRRSNSVPWLFCCSTAAMTLSRIILVTSTTHTKVRLEINIYTEVNTRLHQRRRRYTHAVCRSSIIGNNCQGVNY
jgi:hypothetical protein